MASTKQISDELKKLLAASSLPDISKQLTDLKVRKFRNVFMILALVRAMHPFTMVQAMDKALFNFNTNQLLSDHALLA